MQAAGCCVTGLEPPTTRTYFGDVRTWSTHVQPAGHQSWSDSSGKSPKSVGPSCQKRASQNEANSGSPHPFTVVFAASCERCGDILRGSEMFVQGCKDFWFNAFPNVLCFLRPFVGFVKVKSIRTQPEIIYPNLRLASGIL